MRNVYILISIYNDWDSLKVLLKKINSEIDKIKDYTFNCLVINDASSIQMPSIEKPKNMNSLEIINMKKNTGHARCNAFGIKYFSNINDYDYLIIMDGDGEDRPEELGSLLTAASQNKDKSAVAARIKRSEGIIFRSMYEIHKLLTYFFTGKMIKFGNYSCLTKKNVKFLSEKKSLWSSYSGTLKKNVDSLIEVKSIRGKRYFGPSKMSLISLIIHSFSIIAVFKSIVFLRSAIILIIISFFSNYLGFFGVISQIGLVAFNLIIYLVSLRENEKAFLNCQANKKNSVYIKH